jgi:exopolysaccharide biosynthesis polyprenyl glycosylphosphotransferase
VPVLTLTASHYGSTGPALGFGALLSALWVLALRSAAGAVHFALGSVVRAAVGTVTGLVTVSALIVWLPGLSLPSSTLAVMALSVFALTALWEIACRRVTAKRRVLVVGAGPCASAVLDGVRAEPQTPFAVVGVVDDVVEEASSEGPPLLGPVSELAAIVRAQRPELIVLAEGQSSIEALDRLLAAPSGRFKVVGLAHFFEHAFGRVPVEQLTPGWFMSILHLRQKPYTRFAKRTFDVIGASVGLILAAPVMAVIALLLRTTSGPVIYRQTRVGAGGKLFTMYKFRTMRVDAEEDGALFAAKRDPRVTRLGRVLRTTHLDELPQLWDVLKGDMSIVGPRPERPEFAPMLEEAIPYFNRRLLIKPGVTGWAQLRADYSSDAEGAATKLSYDLWYLRHRNLLVDAAICAKTVTSVIFRPGR